MQLKAVFQRFIDSALSKSNQSSRWIILFGTGTRIFALGAQLLVLFVLARILEKSTFGDAMTVFAFYRIGSMGLGTGLAAILLYHISRHPDDRAAEIRLHRTVALSGVVLSMLAGSACSWGASSISEVLFHNSMLASWFVAFAPFLLFSTLNTIAIGALDGRSRIAEALLIAEAAPNALRLVLLPLGALLALPDTMVAHVMTLSVGIPWLWPARRLFDRSVKGFAHWTRWDLGYVSKFVALSFSSLTLQGFDMIVVSALFSSAIAAEYAVAARLAALYPFFQFIIVRQFSPKAGRLLQLKDYVKLQAAVTVCRRTSIIAVVGSMAVIIGALPLVLPFLGDFQSAIPIAILLTLPPVIRSVFASCDKVIQMAGYANLALAIQFGALCIIVGFPFATHTVLGIACVPISMAIAAVLFNPVAATILRRRIGLKTIGKCDVALILATTCAVGVSITMPAPWNALVITGFYLAAGAAMALTMKGERTLRDLLSLVRSLGGSSAQP